MHNRDFYRELPSLTLPLDALFPNPFPHFQPVPRDWQAVVLNITNVDRAISEKRYREVNVAVVSGVVALVNLAKKHQTEVPFVFGGDAATVLIPSELAMDAAKALTSLEELVWVGLGLKLAISLVPIADLPEKSPLSVSKVSITEGYHQAVFLGNGLLEAEKMAIQHHEYALNSVGDASLLDLTGLQCRWQEIPTPKGKEEIICLVVNATTEESQSELYATLLTKINEVYGPYGERHPVRPELLHPSTSIHELRNESLVQVGRVSKRRTAKQLLLGILGKVHLPLTPGYRQRVVAATDTLKVDGALRTIMAGTSAQREALLAHLQELEKNKQLRFGHYVTKGSIMTCYVHDRQVHHLHFLDGIGGGYTQAWEEYRRKQAV